MLVIQKLLPLTKGSGQESTKEKKEKGKKTLLHQSAGWCYLWICIARLVWALKEDNWLDRKATWWEELQTGSGVCASAEFGVCLKQILKPGEDTERFVWMADMKTRCPLWPAEECETDCASMSERVFYLFFYFNVNAIMNLFQISTKKWN